MQNIAKFLFLVVVFTAVSYPSSQFAANQNAVTAEKPDPFINVA